MNRDLAAWLLDTDPALRWQVQRDLLDAPEQVWQATRALVAREGFGARLLAHQDPDGQWAGGAFFPAGWGEQEMRDQPQPWTATTWSLTSLREWGVDHARLGDTAQRLAEHSRWEYDDLPFWDGEVDCCINAFTLASGTWLGVDVSTLEDWFERYQMEDGGWNCAWEWNGATVGSVQSTLNVLDALRYREESGVGDLERLRRLRHGGEEYLLKRGLMRRRSTGELIGDFVGVLAYPFRSHYDVLRALDHFRRASLLDGTAPDPRLEEAVELVRSRQDDVGRWVQEARHGGLAWFEVDVPVGQPSPWLTLYGLRVLAWWDGSAAQRT